MLKKILFLSHDSELKGAERCLLEAVSLLDKSAIEPLVMLPWPGPLENELKKNDVPYLIRYVIKHWIPYRKHATWTYPFTYAHRWRGRLWSLLHLIEKENIDLVYTNTTTILDGALAARRARIPHIWHIHEYLRGNHDLFSYLPPFWADKIICRLSDRIITPSHALGKQRFPKAGYKLRTVSNGIDLSLFRSGDSKKLKASFQIPPNAPLITFIGGLSRIKDPLTFIQAAAWIVKERPNTHFLLAGGTADPEIAHQAKTMIDQANLAGRCHLLGQRNDVADLLAAATVHVSTSIQETFGRTLIEAMASGKPVVATRCGGPEEVVMDGETGFIVEPQNPQAVADAVIQLLNHPDMAWRFGQAGRARVEKYFTVQAYAGRIGEIITEVCSPT